MKLSIIVPVYNMALDHKLSFCLDSLMAQTISDYEIICVDDASTDSSRDILKEYEEKSGGKIRVFFSDKNRHQGGAKNIALTKATGEWIGFVDSDDWVAPDMYEKLLTKAEKTGADVVGCDYSLVEKHTFEVGKVIANSRDDQVGELDLSKKKSLIMDGGSLCVKIFKRDRILERKLFFPEDIFYEDNVVGNSYLVTASHFEYVKEPLYYYYQHDSSTVHTVTMRRLEDRMVAGRQMIKLSKEHGYFEECKDELEYKFTILFYMNTLFSYVRSCKHVNLSFIQKMGRELRETFPDFDKNPYYEERINPEEKKLVRMQQKSTVLFLMYYRALWTYRKLRGLS